MNKNAVLRSEKMKLAANLVAGLVLMAVGIYWRMQGTALGWNPKALIGLGFIPLAIAIGKAVQLYTFNRHPKESMPVLIAMSDERLQAERNAADAAANRFLTWLLYLLFLGYSLMFPTDVFETPAWWILFALFILATLLPAAILGINNRNKSVSES
jgi:hypothetical protein